MKETEKNFKAKGWNRTEHHRFQKKTTKLHKRWRGEGVEEAKKRHKNEERSCKKRKPRIVEDVNKIEKKKKRCELQNKKEVKVKEKAEKKAK